MKKDRLKDAYGQSKRVGMEDVNKVVDADEIETEGKEDHIDRTIRMMMPVSKARS